MDLDRIFMKDACPTAIGGQAVMEGIMMRGPKKIALAVRTGDDSIRLETKYGPKTGKLGKVPLIRGVIAFWQSMVEGTKTLMDSATILEESGLIEAESTESIADRFEEKLRNRFGDKKAWSIMIYLSALLAIIFSVGVFVLLPTWVVGFFSNFIKSEVWLSFIEGIFRLILFLAYIVAISKLEEIKRVFQYHGAEHKTIHCFEKGLSLTASNAQSFYRLHPRCGTSFLIFVMIITLLIFPLFGWPSLWERLLSRIIMIPVIAGLSYEVLKWAGTSNSTIVKVLSMPGIYLQKITTQEPDESMLEVAIVAMKAVLPEENDKPLFNGIVDNDGNVISDTPSLDQDDCEDMVLEKKGEQSDDDAC